MFKRDDEIVELRHQVLQYAVPDALQDVVNAYSTCTDETEYYHKVRGSVLAYAHAQHEASAERNWRAYCPLCHSGTWSLHPMGLERHLKYWTGARSCTVLNIAMKAARASLRGKEQRRLDAEREEEKQQKQQERKMRAAARRKRPHEAGIPLPATAG